MKDLVNRIQEPSETSSRSLKMFTLFQFCLPHPLTGRFKKTMFVERDNFQEAVSSGIASHFAIVHLWKFVSLMWFHWQHIVQNRWLCVFCNGCSWKWNPPDCSGLLFHFLLLRNFLDTFADWMLAISLAVECVLQNQTSLIDHPINALLHLSSMTPQ